MSAHNSLLQSERQNSTFGSRLVQWLRAPAKLLDRRIARRLPDPPLRAYLGMVGAPLPMPVANISTTGFFLVTDEQWQPGTCLPMRLERTDRLGFAAISRMAVQTCVARKDKKGVGFVFLPINEPDLQQEMDATRQDAWGQTRWADQKAIVELVTDLEAAHPAP